MKKRLVLGGFVLGFAAAATLGWAAQNGNHGHDSGHDHAHGQDHGHDGGHGGQGDGDMTPEMAAMMAAWERYMTPGPAHGRLANMVGDWDLEVKMFMGPDAPPTVSNASATYRMGMGGRYLLEDVKGSFEGHPFEGMGVTGYDNALGQYVFTWIDNAGTGIMRGLGTMNSAGDTMTTEVWAVDPMTGREKRSRGRERFINADTRISEVWDTTENGDEYLSMQLTYTRRK